MIQATAAAPILLPPLPAVPAAPARAAAPSLRPLPADSYRPRPATTGETEGTIGRRVFAPVLRAFSSMPLFGGLILAISRWSEPVPKDARLPNFAVVSPGVWRGGLPSRQGYEELARRGVRTVVNLAAEHNEEAAFLPQMGIRHVPLLIHPFRPPTMDEAFRFLRVAMDPRNGPVYVHCYHGKDRTGAMVAVYRIARDGWTAEQAIAEMRRYGLHEDYHADKVAFVRQFEKVWRDPVARARRLAPRPA